MYPQVIDANINRISEGLRVIEDYARFVKNDDILTSKLVHIRHAINQSEINHAEHLAIRDTHLDVRAKEEPRKRQSLTDLLKANFKRIEEGLRVLEEYTGNALYNSLRYDVYALEKDILLPLLKPQIKQGVYFISDSVEQLTQALDQGVSLIQLRDKYADKATIFQKAKVIVPLAKTAKVPIIINDFLDIALRVDADGLHTGQDDISLSELRKLIGEHKLLGRTTHTLEQGLEAQAQGADYVSVGPIWPTPSKPGREGIGVDYLSKARANLHIPYVAIGGINANNVVDILPYAPPLVGLIRDFSRMKTIIALKQQCSFNNDPA